MESAFSANALKRNYWFPCLKHGTKYRTVATLNTRQLRFFSGNSRP